MYLQSLSGYSQTHSQEAIGRAQVAVHVYRGPDHSVATMQRLFHKDRKDPRARAVAEDAIKGIYGKDYLSEAAAIYYAVCRGTRYTRDPATVELVKDLEVALKTRQIDCDEQCLLLSVLLTQIGITPIQYVTVGFGPGQISHVFLRFKDPRGSGRWIVLDPVAGPTTATMLTRVQNHKVYNLA